jgi:DNA-binding FrmR family transcriptional regulator
MAAIRDDRHKRDLVMRLKRIEGQLRGIQAMIEKGAECEQVSQQLSASRRALDKTFFQVVACAIQGGSGRSGTAEERLREAAQLLARFG